MVIADRVVMDLEGVAAVLEVVAGRVGPRRELSRFAHDREPGAETVRHRRADDEAARLDAEHHVGASAVALDELVDGRPERRGVREQRGDVLEHDPRLRKVGDVADVPREIRHGAPSTTSDRISAARWGRPGR